MIINSQSLSIIIPIGDIDSSWVGLLHELAQQPGFFEVEVLLVVTFLGLDLQSLRLGVVLQENRNVRLILVSRAGRARQLNCGAVFANGGLLWFLHGDSRLAKDFRFNILNSLPKEHVPRIWYFDLTFWDGTPWMKVTSWGVWMRSRILGLPFGDQGLVMTLKSFWELSGFLVELPYAEDLDLILRAQKQGIKILPLGYTLATSARKYIQIGWLRVTVRHLILTYRMLFAGLFR